MIRANSWILVFCVALLPFSFAHAAGGVLYVSPDRGSYTIGEVFEVQVLADSGGEPINAAEAELRFDPTGLAVEEVRIEGSILDSWPTAPIFSNVNGTITFAGWTKEPYVGADGLLITVRFNALRTTRGSARLAAGAILAADGHGSNIITALKSGVYTIEPAQIFEPELQEPELELDAENESATTTEEVTIVEPPQFKDFSHTIVAGERIIAEGSAVPNARVFVYLAKGQEEPSQASIMTTSDGSFTFVSDQGAEEGVYRLWAEVQDRNGIRSPLSKTVTLNVQSAGLASAVSSGATLITAVLPLLALLILTGLAAGYLLHRHKVEKLKLVSDVGEEH